MARSKSRRVTRPTSASPVRPYLYAGAYSVRLGFGVFFMRYLGVQHTGLGTFLVNWYGGALVARAGLSLITP